MQKIITKNGELRRSDRRSATRSLPPPRQATSIFGLLDEANKGLDDIAAGRVTDATAAFQAIKRRRALKMSD